MKENKTPHPKKRSPLVTAMEVSKGGVLIMKETNE